MSHSSFNYDYYFRIDRLSILSEDGYNHDSPENTEYIVPVTIYAEQGYGLELEDSGDEATDIQVYLSLRYKFGRWDNTLRQYTNIEQLQSDVGDNGEIFSDREITFGKQIGKVDVGTMTRFENIRIPTVRELYDYYGFTNSEGVDLIECEILNVYIRGDFNQTKIRLQISNDLKYPSIPNINDPSADGLGVSADGVYNSEELNDDDELEQIYEYFKEKYSMGNFPQGHVEKDNLPIGNSQMIEMSTEGQDSNILRDVFDYIISDESLPPQIEDSEASAANVFFFEVEEESPDFNIPNVNIEQTLSSSFDPFSGMNINTDTFQNKNQSLIDSNQDGRIELGLFFFEEDNLSSEDFPITFRNTIFNQIKKVNLLTNGDCKGVDKNYSFSDTDGIQRTNVIKPSGGWKFLNFDGVGFKRKDGEIEDVDIEPSTNETLLEYKNYYTQNIDIGGGEFLQTPQGNFGYGGYLPYIPFTDIGLDKYYKALPESSWNQMLIDGSYSPANDDDIEYDFPVDIYEDLNPPDYPYEGLDAPIPPPIASWIRTDKAYSNNRCLVFHSLNPWGEDQLLNFFKYFWIFNSNEFSGFYEDGVNSGILSLFGSDDYTIVTDTEFSIEPTDEEYKKFTENQYRVLNQSQLIHRQESDLLNPYSSLKVKFKMYTDRMTDSNVGMPQVEVGVLTTDFLTPQTDGYQTEILNYENGKMSTIVPEKVGGFNSTSYYTGSNLNDKRYDYFGSMIRVENSDLNKWESFEFNFNIANMSGINSLQTLQLGGVNVPEFDNNGNINLDYYLAFVDTNGLTFQDEGGVGSGPAIQNSVDYNSFYAMKKVTTAWNGLDQPIDELVNPFVVNTYEIYSSVVNEFYTLQSGDGGGIPDPFKLIYKIEDSYGNSVTQNFATGDFDTNNWTTERVLKTNEEYTFYFFCEFTLDVAFGEGFSTYEIKEIKQTFALPNITVSAQADEIVQDVNNLLFVVQSGNNFRGRVLLDDFEVYESYEFIPDVDVRKKISVGNYGAADLTKYYDRDLQPNEYNDSTAPLEAQFYFYPTYPTDKVFDITRTPIYQDFKKGLFYIYDVNWGDGSPNEFVNEPEQINENTALYHTYETHGVFEITGFMMRLKPNKIGEPEGLAHNKRFKLRININPGLDEDFEYYGSDGFSFIPFKNTTPIIGGISKQSIYYKSLKRLLGFIDDDIKTNVSFNSKGDRLKTELALLKMENQNYSDLEVLPAYMIQRFDENSNLIYNGITPIIEQLGEGIGDCDLTNIKYYSEPKSIWEMFGFEEQDLSEVGTPNNPRYWKNIIPEGYSIFNREGISINGGIDTYANQDWIGINEQLGFGNKYYYPVLPKYGSNGKFVDIQMDEENNVVSGYPFESLGNSVQSENRGGTYFITIIYGDGSEQTIDTGVPRLQTTNEFNEPTSKPIKIAYVKTADKRYDVCYESISDSFESMILQYKNIDLYYPPQQELEPGAQPEPIDPDPSQFEMSNSTSIYTAGRSLFWIDGNFNTNNSTPAVLPSEPDFLNYLQDIGPPFVYPNNGLPPQFNTTGENVFRKIFTLDFNDVDSNGIYGNPGAIIGPNRVDCEVYKSGHFTAGEHTFEESTNTGFTTADVLGLFDLTTGETGEVTIIDNGDYFIDYSDIYNNNDSNGDNDDNDESDFNDYGDGSNNSTTPIKTPFSPQGSITDEKESSENLSINITKEQIDTNVFDDKSGNENLGFVISDYKPNFDNNTLKPRKIKKFNGMKTKTKNGAF